MDFWKPTSGPDTARRRAAMIARVRHYFRKQEVLEVDTPALSPFAVTDTQIECIEASSSLTRSPLYLHTSPEFTMKRLLAAGYPDIYSICRVFRDGEAGHLHQPEFTMLEWYRRGFGLNDIAADTVRVIATALSDPTLADNVEVVNYCDAVLESTGLDPNNASVDELSRAASSGDDLRRAIGDERDDWLDLLLTLRVIPAFSLKNLTVLQHYPASQAALARLCPENSDVADRFEVFMGPVELANGYVELTDAAEQRHRMEQDQANRRRRQRPLRAPDETLLAALESGLPDCAGVALGLERLQMVLDKTGDIRDVVSFAFQESHG